MKREETRLAMQETTVIENPVSYSVQKRTLSFSGMDAQGLGRSGEEGTSAGQGGEEAVKAPRSRAPNMLLGALDCSQ